MLDPWHFPRPELAAQYLKFFQSGISSSLVLFARRRAGKTEMLLQDLAPAAEAAGYRVAYASFWQSTLAPVAVLLYALEKSLERKSLSERVRQFLTTPVTKLKLSGELPGAKGAAELDLNELHGAPPNDLLLYLDDLFARLAKGKRHLLLLLDEVQELALDASNRPLIAALRTVLDRHKQRVAVVFTGSSQDGLRNMFLDREAPFFHFSTQIDLPALDERFVRHISAVFKKVTSRRLDDKDANKAFQAVHHNPFYFRKLVEVLITRADLDVSGALQLLRERIPVEQGYTRAWTGLRSLDRQVLVLIGGGTRALFSREACATLGKRLGTEAPKPAAVQGALRRLLSARLIIRTGAAGVYDFDDPEFRQWIHSLPAKQ